MNGWMENRFRSASRPQPNNNNLLEPHQERDAVVADGLDVQAGGRREDDDESNSAKDWLRREKWRLQQQQQRTRGGRGGRQADSGERSQRL